MEVPTIEKALNILETMNLNENERESYEARLKWLRDEELAIKTAERKGMEAGIEKGAKEKSIEIAKNLLDVLDAETISLKTGLTLEEIEELKNKS